MEEKRKRGRPRTKTQPGEKPSDGNPSIRVRMEPWLHDWVKTNGGPEFVRRVLRDEYREQAFWSEFHERS